MNADRVKTKKKERLWPLWSGLLLAGVLLLAEAFGVAHLTKWTARLGIGLIYSAAVVIAAGGRWPAFTGVAAVWISIILCYIL